MYAFVLKLPLYIWKGYADKPVLLHLENTKTKGLAYEAIAVLGLTSLSLAPELFLIFSDITQPFFSETF